MCRAPAAAFRYGPDRKLYLPGGLLDRSEVPAYLNGSLAGDYGYDPLGLGKDGAIEKYQANELLHARWAMLVSERSCLRRGGQAWRGAQRHVLELLLRRHGMERAPAVPTARQPQDQGLARSTATAGSAAGGAAVAGAAHDNSSSSRGARQGALSKQQQGGGRLREGHRPALHPRPRPAPAAQAAAGAIIPEGLAANGADIKGATWFETGAAMLNGGTLNWFAVPWGIWANPLPLFAVVAINVSAGQRSWGLRQLHRAAPAGGPCCAAVGSAQGSCRLRGLLALSKCACGAASGASRLAVR